MDDRSSESQPVRRKSEQVAEHDERLLQRGTWVRDEFVTEQLTGKTGRVLTATEVQELRKPPEFHGDLNSSANEKRQAWEKEVALRKQSTEAQKRKATPIFSGVLAYFPDALAEVARVSVIGNEQHNPGQPLHWDKSKSKDELDALVRHLLDHQSGELYDTDGALHLAKVVWRAMAALQRLKDAQR